MSDGHHAPLSYHARMLRDFHRLDAYERAIRRLVKPGDVVLDLGCGTGILAMLAARRGARVHAVESTPVAGLAEELIANNGLSHLVTVHHADIRKLEPVEPVDLVVSDFLGVFLVDDQMLPAVVAAGRWLKPGGRFCPVSVELHVAPAGDMTLVDVDCFANGFYGLDLSAAQPHAVANCYRLGMSPTSVLAPAVSYHVYTPPEPLRALDKSMRFVVERAGRLRGFMGWFQADFAPGITLSSAPGIETHWGQYLFTVPATDVLAGDELNVRLVLDELPDDDTAWRWEGSVRRGDEELLRFALEEEEWFGQRKRVTGRARHV